MKEYYLDDIAMNIEMFCRKWGRFGGQSKEKYGTVRFYVHFVGLSLHTLVYPGYVYIQFPKWLNRLDDRMITPILNFFFGRIYRKYQVYIYNKAYQRMLKKYPNEQYAILSCADFPEYIYGAAEYLAKRRVENLKEYPDDEGV